MDDFIRPNKKEVKLPTAQRKNRGVRQVVVILIIIVCLSVGFISGYLTSHRKQAVMNGEENTILNEVYNELNQNWYNSQDGEFNLQSKAIEGLVNGLEDPHTSFWTSDQSDEFNQSVNGDYEGIGVNFTTVDNGAMIVKVFAESPAAKVGLQVGDIIIKADTTDLAGKTSDEIVGLVRGEPGSQVSLTIVRSGQELVVEPTRNKLSTAVFYEIREQDGEAFGYVEITTFGATTGVEVENALTTFMDNGITTLVLDLRGNGGGYLTAAIDILELFFDEGETLYQMQSKEGPAEIVTADSEDKYSFANGYILVNGNTASASEMVAGALQEQLGYQLVGEQTYGKGTAQTQHTLSNGSVLKYTYARWMTPDGVWINDKGLTPDIKVENHDITDVTTEELKSPLQVDQVDVKILSMQKMLSIVGYDCGRMDGYFSTQTEEALRSFERDNGLPEDGQCDNTDFRFLIGRTMIVINDKGQDLQYKRLLEEIKK